MSAPATQSTSQEGEWELRDGKFFRKSTKTITATQPPKIQVCQNCPQKDREIITQKNTIKQLQEMLANRDAMITSLRERLEKLELQSREWITERSKFESTIQSLNRTIEELRIQIRSREDWVSRTVLMEKETIINNLQIRIRNLEQELEGASKHVLIIRERDTRIVQLETRLRELESQVEFCKANHTDRKEPPVVNTRWYYAVQNHHHAQLFQMHPRYQGGEVVVDSLEGATILNPEYYSQSEKVPGNARLRVRVVDAVGIPMQAVGSLELFVRMRLASATQFTQPKPFTPFGSVMWQQDFVFVEVPLVPHSYYSEYFVPSNPLYFEIVLRSVGTSQEQIIGCGSADLADLVVGLTRTMTISLDRGGVINVRIKALDFGLPNKEENQLQYNALEVKEEHRKSEMVHGSANVKTTYNVSDAEMAHRLDASDGVLDGRYGDANINVRESQTAHSNVHHVTSSGGPTNVKTTYNVSDAEMAHRLDASDGVMDGRCGGADINVRGSQGVSSSGAHTTHSKTTYNVASEEMAKRLDAADGVIDGKYGNADINLKK